MNAFTATQIAFWLEISPQAVRKALRGSPASCVRVVNGNETQAWTLDAMSLQLRRRLEAAARQQRFLNAERMLSAPPKAAWPPPAFPTLKDIADFEIERAGKLREAFLPSLLNQHNGGMTAAEFNARGVAEYARIFGRTITSRYWFELFKKTLRRDAGAENFNRLELYLPEKPVLKKNPARAVHNEPAADFSELSSFIAACSNPVCPTEIETRGIWTLALKRSDTLTGQGMPAKRAARCVREFLFSKAAFLAPSRNALLKSFNRKLARWQASGQDAKALRDKREKNGPHFELPEADRDRLIHRAVFYYRGDIAPAWRDCLRNGFSESTRARYAGKSSDKSHVPTSVHESITPEVEILTVMHQGPRAFDSIKGHITRSYDGIHSLHCLSGDDFTLNTYFYVPDGHGWFTLTRGQVILFVDFRSLRILGWALEPRRSYSSLTIRSLCTHVFAEFGVPEILYFERGLWKSATLLKGKTDPFTFTEISQGLREFGIKFMHAIRPRTKTVERIGGMFQDIAEAEPGYCGRDERRDAPESLRRQMAEVEARNVHPSKYFYSCDQWNRRIGQLVEQYNAESQHGRILSGLSPDQGFEAHINPDNPPMQFSAGLRYLLAHDKRLARITLNGVTIQVGKQKFNYRGAEIAHLVGREVLAWFDPENPETIVVTNPDRTNPICVARSESPNALECLIEPGSGTLNRELGRIEGQAFYMQTRYNVVKAKFPLPQRRLLSDAQTAETVELGAEMEERKSRTREKAARKHRQQNRAYRFARKTGIAVRDPALLEGKEDDARILSEYLNAGKEAEK